ncbi:MAG: hypothetical protein HY650_16865, partial [Acidobacteria bacterium]|nr:hypothetical protein [Acidobacteriota bacterium]
MQEESPNSHPLAELEEKCFRRAILFGALSAGAGTITVINLVAMARIFWEPSQFLSLPLYMLFAAAALLASVSFARSSRRLIQLRASSRLEKRKEQRGGG